MSTWQQDMAEWDKGRLDIHEIERRLQRHGLSENEISSLLPDLILMKSLYPETDKCAVHTETAMICPRCIGADGGSKKTPAKRKASIANGKLGGRPKKKP